MPHKDLEKRKEYHKQYNERMKSEKKIKRKKFYNKNREEILKEKKEYHQKNKETILEKKKEYYKENKERIREEKKVYYRKNKDKIIEQKRIYQAERVKNDLSFKLKYIVSSSISKFLNKKNFKKNNESILKYLPYTIKELIIYLESLFEPWMNWDNYGVYRINDWNDEDQSTWKWQIDHIVPQSDLPYISMEDNNFKKCWALDNLRPLSAKQNVKDGVRYE